MRKINVLVVDDSAFIRKMIIDILSLDNEVTVADVAKNGKEALEKLNKNKDIDVVTLDVEMPIMDGIQTLKEIMQKNPIPVVMLSSLTKSGADLTIQALNIGAVDFLTKPSNIFKINSDEMKSLIIDKVKIASKIKVSKNVIKKDIVYNDKGYIKKISTASNDVVENIVAIGTSTGGPRALQQVVPNISPNIKAPIVIVQHMPPGFTKSLADRLNQISKIEVKEAEHGEILKNGVGYIAPGDKHMNFEKRGKDIKIVLNDGSKVSGHRPSVDSMFLSLSKLDFNKVICVLMTGMGADGALGMKELKKKPNVVSIAEDESTCVVFGMPKSAVNLGVVDSVLKLNQISSEINMLMGV
ncbi:protein-glutamate methylesterase/protein-glutamine glutaminase [Alkalithermobacter paradoxus]|uniref:Protein-glutamate methylesterase/protein-glutamine glutaminase n=1 Tax=Alkalithermobacter paradoxus TaxID=29349 RepID=A0A1V4IB03_9FIRM|nr:chemotaxis response regulator protein-glutamate methylesterase [[Clostridium] thermoalcaliphilum]